MDSSIQEPPAWITHIRSLVLGRLVRAFFIITIDKVDNPDLT